ncbi:alpha/beta fold hydrolase [Mycolicibacterium komossense]|uniref:Alpha/beta fold hydrolase n=1 Tax=Mycolicibacterium komossense TaxID=1779 RepID=A0ABT3C4U3_9MYCO|nr:alpha/beta fold hydrolase [Mycolicibacterium komossense]MCV7224504.1 alpha/beta fold hydrolase [Mycolicibacterium komossense]
MNAEPRSVDIATPAVTLRVLVWDGPEPDAPIALCLHGFPDTAYGFRKLAPLLVAAGYRVVAPFMRGYAPSSLPTDGSYHIGAVMHDALRVRDEFGPSDRDLLIGHDWGAIAATGLAALPADHLPVPFAKAVIMSVPPSAGFRAPSSAADRGRLLAKLPAQVLRSWYLLFFQLPWLPERSKARMLPLLWRRWSPGYTGGDLADDLAHVEAAIGAPARWRAALGTYRAMGRNTLPPAPYSELHRHWLSAPKLPVLYLHGHDDGCFTPGFTPWVEKVLAPGSSTGIVEHAGHFLQLEQPQRVAELIIEFAHL